MTPGAMVMNEIVPSGFWRDATSLFHSPKSKTVVRARAAHGDLAERGVRVARRRAWRPRPRRPARSSSLRSAASCVEERLGRRRQIWPSASGWPSNSTSSSLRRKLAADQPARVAVGQDHRADAVLRQPHHVAVEADHVAAVMHDRHAVLWCRPSGPCRRWRPCRSATCGARRASSVLLRDVARAVRQLALGELHLRRTCSMSLTLLQAAPAGRTGMIE